MITQSEVPGGEPEGFGSSIYGNAEITPRSLKLVSVTKPGILGAVRRESKRKTPPPVYDLSWQEGAPCKGEEQDLFFPEQEEGTDKAHQAKLAKAVKAICASCILKDQCLNFALESKPSNDYGIWGGTTKIERRRIRKREQERKRRLSKALGLDS